MNTVKMHFEGLRGMDKSFWEHHSANPGIFDRLVEYTYRAKNKGYEHHGIGALFEILRWEDATIRAEYRNYKMCNNHRSRYARLIMINHPNLVGFFRVKSLSEYSVFDRPEFYPGKKEKKDES
jgi:hypothetical protein